MPSFSKKLEAMIDWTSHLFFKRDVAIIERFVRDASTNSTKDIRLLNLEHKTIIYKLEELL